MVKEDKLMKIIDIIHERTGLTRDEILDNECILDYDYEYHEVCDGEHCIACWEREVKS